MLPMMEVPTDLREDKWAVDVVGQEPFHDLSCASVSHDGLPIVSLEPAGGPETRYPLARASRSARGESQETIPYFFVRKRREKIGISRLVWVKSSNDIGTRIISFLNSTNSNDTHNSFNNSKSYRPEARWWVTVTNRYCAGFLKH